MSKWHTFATLFVAMQLAVALGCSPKLSQSAAREQIQAEGERMSESDLKQADKDWERKSLK